ncbi:MAG: hypothetical protein LPK19_05995, partial [Hymenobacteraceae bacterium]|nr:hypothetical protein [Hymenobacteraceae bacterium]MDX5395751.1 hypothetical protein [Hymenobacteraceae bacterium]MDX5511806.1 hypothetical protein [Hymenobacteraceae bacterium]
MRQITLQTNKKNAESILETAKDFEAKNIIQLTEKDQEIITLHLMNRQVGAFLEKLEDYPDVQINLIPRGVITLYPPQDEAPDQVRDVDPKSSIEIFLSSIQSVGSYKGLIGYAVSAGVIVWIGLYTNTFSLLIAAMLIAPYAGPAMNLAIATTAG